MGDGPSSKNIFKCIGIGQSIYEGNHRYPFVRCLGFRQTPYVPSKEDFQNSVPPRHSLHHPRVDNNHNTSFVSTLDNPTEVEKNIKEENKLSTNTHDLTKQNESISSGIVSHRRDICLGVMTVSIDDFVSRCQGVSIKLIFENISEDEDTLDNILDSKLPYVSEDAILPLTMEQQYEKKLNIVPIDDEFSPSLFRHEAHRLTQWDFWKNDIPSGLCSLYNRTQEITKLAGMLFEKEIIRHSTTILKDTTYRMTSILKRSYDVSYKNN